MEENRILVGKVKVRGGVKVIPVLNQVPWYEGIFCT